VQIFDRNGFRSSQIHDHLGGVSDRFILHPYRLPFRAPLRTAHGVWAEREGWWIRRESADGDVTWGEVAPIPGFNGRGKSACGEDLEELGSQPTPDVLAALLARGGEPAFGVGATNWDWRASIEPGPDYLPVAGLLPAGQAVFAAIDARLEMGFRTFKWKVGVADPNDEMAMLDDVLAKLPERSRLRLDANGAWDRRIAERWLSVCADRSMIEYVEQPVSAEDDDLLLGLAEDFPVPLALDESVCGRRDFERWRDRGWPGIYVIKPILWGDPADLVETLRDSGADVVISSGLETVVGARAVLAVAFALGKATRALGTGVWPLFRPDGFDGPFVAPFVHKSDLLNLSFERVEREVTKI
jgi:o-succinylbenzoate synthase